MSNDLFARIEPYLSQVERPSRYIDHEFGATHTADADYRCAFLYPDTYEIGQSNQGLAILGAIVNGEPGMCAERAYVPWVDMADIMRRESIPLFSLESATALADLDMVGMTYPHELACTNMLEALDLAGIPLLAKDRGQDCPIILGGGPSTYNPEPIAPFFDAFLIGEAEESILEFCRLHRDLKARGASRDAMLHAFCTIKGCYVPSLYDYTEEGVVPRFEDVPSVVKKRVVKDFNATRPGTGRVVPYVEATHDRYNVEILRGCSRGCRFCQAGMMYRPVRERTADAIVAAVMEGIACTGYDEVSLTSLSSTDHSTIAEVLRRLDARLSGTDISVSIPSQRLDSFGVEMAQLVAGDKKGGLTFAPEAGTQRLRDIINKNVTEDDLLQATRSAFSAGWRHMKLYFMCGLPGETDDDLIGMGELVGRALAVARETVPVDSRGSVRIGVSCAVFIPKVDTPFQWCGQIPRAEVQRRIGVIRSHMPPRGVDFKWHDPETSLLEGAVSRGDRKMADVILGAWRHGARFDAWTERFDLGVWEQAAAEVGVSISDTAERSFKVGDKLPWSHISCGISEPYLSREYAKAMAGQTTPDCSFTSCTGCGVCQDLDVDIVLDGERHV